MLSAVITEASLRYRWGTYHDRREQIDHLIKMASQSNVQLRIQRLGDGPPIGTLTTIHILGFDGENSNVVFMETSHSIEEVRSQNATDHYVQTFHDACELALDPEDTLHYLMQLSKEQAFGSQRIVFACSRYLTDRYAGRSRQGNVDSLDGATEESNAFDGGFEPDPTRISVAVYVDGSPHAMREVLEEVDQLVQALGYGDPLEETVEAGSIFRRYYSIIRRGVSSVEVRERAIKAERALELLAIDGRQAQVDGQAAAAVQSLVNSLKDVPTACVRIGSILLIKYTKVDGPVVLVRTLSQVEIRTLEKYPEIQRQPEKTLDALAIALTQGESTASPNT